MAKQPDLGTHGRVGQNDGRAKGADVIVEVAKPDDARTMSEVFAMGKAGRRFLGPMPNQAFIEYATKNGVIVARAGPSIVGYAMFAITDRYVRLIHLFVSEDWRGKGVGRLLVDWITTHHADRPGIRVRSALAQGRAAVWAGLGFERHNERPGRSKAGEPLATWWRDHGHPTLFAPQLDQILVRASIDINVLRDIAEPGRTNRDESLALVTDQMSEFLAIVRTPALDVEIDRLSDEVRKVCMTSADGFASVVANEDRKRQARTAIDAALRAAGSTTRQVSPEDVRYVSEAIGAELDVFVTRDAQLMRALTATAGALGLRILRPEEVVVRIDELVRSAAYRPLSLQQTEFTVQLVPAGHSDRLEALAHPEAGESLAVVQRRIRRLTAAGHERFVVTDSSNVVVAGYACRESEGVLEVPFLRVANGPLGHTLARQLLRRLRDHALSSGLTAIRLMDSHTSKAIPAATEEDGYAWDLGTATALVIDAIGTAEEIEHAATRAARAAGVPARPPLRRPISSAVAAELERAWWPAKILDGGLTTWLVPIQPRYSSELLNVPEGLLRRSSSLGLSREHVYYRSPGAARPVAPARVLWYLSKSSIAPAGIVAASHLSLVLHGEPEDLFSRFEHLGVWTLDQVKAVARNGLVQALRFSDTEVFAEPVYYHEVVSIVGSAPQSPRRVDPKSYLDIYRGRGRHG